VNDRQAFRAFLREFLEESKKRTKRGEDHRWIQGTADSLMLSDPEGTMVEPDVRKKIADYFKKMGLMK
jgi:hypothetical protein